MRRSGGLRFVVCIVLCCVVSRVSERDREYLKKKRKHDTKKQRFPPSTSTTVSTMATDEVEPAEVAAEVDTENPEPEPTPEETKPEKPSASDSDGPTMSPIAILIRLLQLSVAVISFAVMASVNGFNDFRGAPSFNYLLATGVLVTAWTLVMICCEFAKTSALAKVEIFVDYVLSLLAFGAFCAAGAIQSKINGTIESTDTPKIVACIFFMMFTWMAMSILPVMAAFKSWTETYATPGMGTAMSQALKG